MVSPDPFHRKDVYSLGVTHFLYLLDTFNFFKEDERRLGHSSVPGPLDTEPEKPSEWLPLMARLLRVRVYLLCWCSWASLL